MVVYRLRSFYFWGVSVESKKYRACKILNGFTGFGVLLLIVLCQKVFSYLSFLKKFPDWPKLQAKLTTPGKKNLLANTLLNVLRTKHRKQLK